MFTRRDVHLASIIGLGLVSVPGMSGSKQLSKDTFNAFREGAKNHPWLEIYRGIDQTSFPRTTAILEGSWPESFRGTLFRNGPAIQERLEHRYEHWFDGDGLIQKWYIDPSAGISHQAQTVATAKLLLEEEHGSHRVDAFGTHLGIEAVGSPDTLNTANTSVVYHADELYALWEGGSAYSLDDELLTTNGPKSFSIDSAGAPFSAHPRVDSTGTLWNFGVLSTANLLVLWEIKPNGKLNRATTIELDPISMPHDFIVTDTHLVILNFPFHYDRQLAGTHSFLQSHTWQSDQSTQAIVIDKNDLQTRFVVELDPQWVFHYSNGYRDKNRLVFQASQYENPNVMTEDFFEVMRGEQPQPGRHAPRLCQYEIDLITREAKQTELHSDLAGAEFPSVPRHLSSAYHSKLATLTKSSNPDSAQIFLPDTVSLVDLEKESWSSYSYPFGQIPEEHLLLSHGGEELVLGSALDWQKQTTSLNLFDANSLADGPIARATISRMMPVGFHGQFVSV